MSLILFVAHNRAFCQAASLIFGLEEDLRTVVQARTVAEGRERVAEGGVGAAIVDISMPGEGAEELVRELHEAGPSVPVLVLTSAARDPGVRERFLEAGASEVLSEGVSFAEVLAAVWRLGDARVLAQPR